MPAQNQDKVEMIPYYHYTTLPSATRGALFEKTAPLDPPEKLFIKGGHGFQQSKGLLKSMTTFESF